MLEVGDKFAGCIVQAYRDSDHGRTWLFVRGNEGVFVTASFSDYFDALANHYNQERFLDQMAMDVDQAIKDKSKKISSLDVSH